MFKFISLIITLSVHIELSSTVFPPPPPETGFEWIDVPFPGEAFLLRPDPAGYEDENESFLCQALIWGLEEEDDRWRPGDLVIRDGEIYCRVVDEFHNVRKFDEFRMINANPGFLSWERIDEDSDLPENAVVGGENPDKSPIHICRVLEYEDEFLYVGILEEGNECWVSTILDDEAIDYTTEDGDIEVLTTNWLSTKKFP